MAALGMNGLISKLCATDWLGKSENIERWTDILLVLVDCSFLWNFLIIRQI